MSYRGLARYTSFSASGVQWLDQSPTHWRCVPMKYLALGTGSIFIDGDWIESKDLSNSGIRYLTTGNVGEGEYREQGEGYISDSKFEELRCTEVLPGDVLVSRLNRPIGRACSVPELGSRIVTSVDNVIVRPDDEYDRKYLVYLFSSKEYFKHTANLARGATMQRISRGLLGNIRIIAPPLPEQTQIARFLDYETAKIDELIDKQQQLIALLKEKRQAVISHAVTKGLNPDAPMKDSGVEWLGEVPAHWVNARLKQLTYGATSGPYGSSLTKSMYTNGGIRVYGQQQAIAGDFSIGDYFISPKKFRKMTRYEVFPGDILVTVMGTIGRVTVVPPDIDRGIINPRLVRYKANLKTIIPEFLRLSILGEVAQSYLKLMAQGSTMEGLNMQILGALNIPLPPLDEQASIVRRVKLSCSRLDSLVEAATLTTDLLQERRTALISAAVTGKIDVRNWKHPNEA